MKVSNGYSRIQIGLHWLTAVLIVTVYFMGDGMSRALRTRIEQGQTGLEGGTLHGMLGSLVFLLVLIRIVVRIRSGAPAVADGTPPLMALAAKWGHRLLYLLMVMVPLGGMISWFGHLRNVGDLHATVGNALIWVALAHALVAIYHHVVLKDGTLNRMRKPGA